ncbi:MAG: type II toxin-antitoxin system MqsA family antitoxin, partial [Nitrospirae bacterium]|nr:type II toxin-antitoxin system MqsA family antitoxin [Nitrospirota bacterium]
MEKCVFCGGRVEKQLVSFVYDEDGNYFVVEHVPAEVCTSCGERTYSAEITDEILGFSKHKATPSKT